LLHVRGYGRSHLIETGAAVHGPIVSRREWNHCLLATFGADGCVIFARSSHHAVALRDRAARGAPLRVVLQTLAREERLLPRRKREMLAAVAASQNPILVHPLSLHETPGAPLHWACRGGESTVTLETRGYADRTPGMRSPGGFRSVRLTGLLLTDYTHQCNPFRVEKLAACAHFPRISLELCGRLEQHCSDERSKAPKRAFDPSTVDKSIATFRVRRLARLL
jgi:hypothetical protein